ncbi:isoprenyl transferase [Anaeroselena agilis]|uniref:Isoprenyl transferase n=1 Tax=Anaeroselena agilis TaxID=3063788 RepID=A0ABU3NWY8_9FIRM|nr:isoprenyl transferase [Selenomonadales bacterium 4137-cl]
MWKKWFGRSDQRSESSYGDLDPARVPRHVAIIMDGNGRWAQKRGLPRTFGHRAGAEALRAIVRTAAELGIGVLTTYAFSTENWKRPAEEVDLLMNLFSDYLDNEIEELNSNGIRVRFSGKTEELAAGLKAKIDRAEGVTAANERLVLNIAVNYGGRAEITHAVRLIAAAVAAGSLKAEDVSEEVISRHLYTAGLPDLDLLIRPAGDLRISNFLLWQAAYAEFWFTDINWPDFRPEHLIAAVADFQRRDRRFGGLTK